MAPDSETPVATHRKTKAAQSKAATETAAVKAKKGTKHQRSLGEEQEKELEAVVAAEIPEPTAPGKKKQKNKNKKIEQPTIQLQAPVPSPLAQLVEIPGDILKDGAKVNKKKQAMALRAARGIKLENGELKRTEDASAKLSKKEQASVLGTPRKKSHARRKAVVPVGEIEVEESEVEVEEEEDEEDEEETEEEDDLLPVYRTFHPGGGRFLPIAPIFSKNEQFVTRNLLYFCQLNLLTLLQIHAFSLPTRPPRLLHENLPPKPYLQHSGQQPRLATYIREAYRLLLPRSSQ